MLCLNAASMSIPRRLFNSKCDPDARSGWGKVSPQHAQCAARSLTCTPCKTKGVTSRNRTACTRHGVFRICFSQPWCPLYPHAPPLAVHPWGGGLLLVTIRRGGGPQLSALRQTLLVGREGWDGVAIFGNDHWS